MRPAPLTVTLLLCLAGPALASPCTDEVAALETQAKSEATAAIATSTGSKEVAARRESRAQTARDAEAPVTAIPNAPAPGSAEAKVTQQAVEAGAGGDRTQQALAALNRARASDGEGKDPACRDALAEARRLLDR